MYGTCTYIWLIFMVDVGRYTSPMDPMGTWHLSDSGSPMLLYTYIRHRSAEIQQAVQ